jgi:bifunctional non-homologous end joining protein LigD
MLASLDAPPLQQRGLVYEPKYDGIRALASLEPGAKRGQAATVRIYSRNGRAKDAQFPEVTAALAAWATKLETAVIVDGEIVATDARGRPLGFQHIQGRIHLTKDTEIADAARKQPTVFVMFDVLRVGDDDWRRQPLAARRLKLQELFGRPRAKNVLRLSDLSADDGRAMLAVAKRDGWEGLIVKDGHSVYESGRRSPAWRKLKLTGEQEFVIGGWTEPRESRSHFGALVLGYYDKQGLRFAGSVGTGFDQKELDRVAELLATRKAAKNPFIDPVRTMEAPHWVRPDLVAAVRFTEWTSDGVLRHPVYLGLRDDKRARDVVRESGARAADPPAVPIVHTHRRRATTHEPKKPSRGRRAADGAIDDLVGRLEVMERTRKDGDVALPNGDTLRVTNLAKVFWPGLGITKGELIRYYVRVSPLLLPVVADRPLVMRRFPNGIVQHAFYQQRHPEAPPHGVQRMVLPDDVEAPDADGPRERLIGGSLTTLLYMAQLAAISQDPWFSRVSDPHHQDHAAIDLDPGDDTPFSAVIDVARWVKEVLDAHGIPAYPKTSGASGLHIYVPLPPGTTYETGQLLCQMVATSVAQAHPKVATVERMVRRRPKGTVYVDYLQNILGKTIATAYSARASEYAGVSTPLRWTEVTPSLDPRAFTIRTAPARFAEVGDLWADLRTKKPVDLARLVSQFR